MLGPSASLVIIVYGERDSNPMGSKRSLSMIPCIAIYGKRHSYALGSKRPLSMIPGIVVYGKRHS